MNRIIATRTPLNKVPRSFDADLDSNKKPVSNYEERAKLAVVEEQKSDLQSDLQTV